MAFDLGSEQVGINDLMTFGYTLFLDTKNMTIR